MNNHSKQVKRVIVIGGGVSGLACAYLIQTKAHQHGINIDLKLIEKEATLGGKIKSQHADGYLYEWGPSGFLANKPLTLALCQRLGIADQLLISNDKSRKRFIYANKALHQLPHSFGQFLASRLLSFAAKLRLAAEIMIPKARLKGDESVAQFVRRRLGAEALDKLITPMASGIFAGDPEKMALKSCFPRIYELEHRYGGLIKAMLKLMWRRRGERKAANNVSATGPSGKLTSFVNGLQVLTDSLVDHIGQDKIIMDEVTALASLNPQYLVKTHQAEYVADLVISAVPAYSAAQLVSSVDKHLSSALAQISYAPLVVVCSCYALTQIPRELEGFGYLLAKDEPLAVLGTLWESAIFMQRAPAGKVLLRTMLGGACQRHLLKLNDEQLLAIVRDSFKQILGITTPALHEKILRHEQAIPEYNIGHSQLLNQIEQQLHKQSGLFLTGNAYSGVGINDCIMAAEAISDKVIHKLMM